MAPKVSVIIPTYNRRDYLIEAVESVLAQTYQDFEIIVVDDGSNDNTEIHFAEFIQRTPAAKGRIFYCKQKNSGPAIARNHGIFRSCGEYIAFLDSDDLWYPEKLEKQVGVLDENPEIDLVYADCYSGESRNDPNQNGFFVSENLFSGYIFERIAQNNIFWTSSLLLRRNVFILAGVFDPTLRSSEDYDLWLRICYYHQCYYIPEVLGLFRKHDNRMTKSIRFSEYAARTLEVQMVRWKDKPDLIKVFRCRAISHYIGTSRKFRDSGDFSRSIYYLKEAKRLGHSSLRTSCIILILRFCPDLFRWYDNHKKRKSNK